MSLPKRTAAYPANMITALQKAQTLGEVIIPTDNPQKMRLQFQGLRGALRAEGQSELADTVAFTLQKDPPAFVIRLRDASPMALAIDAALKAHPPSQSPIPQPSASDEAEASLARILGRF